MILGAKKIKFRASRKANEDDGFNIIERALDKVAATVSSNVENLKMVVAENSSKVVNLDGQ